MAKHLRIRGIVQGVGYRAGFEAMVRGDDTVIQQLIAWAQRGPAMARVDHIDIVETNDAQIAMESFDIRPTE